MFQTSLSRVRNVYSRKACLLRNQDNDVPVIMKHAQTSVLNNFKIEHFSLLIMMFKRSKHEVTFLSLIFLVKIVLVITRIFMV